MDAGENSDSLQPPGYCACGRVAGRTGRCGTCDHNERKRERNNERDELKKSETNTNRTFIRRTPIDRGEIRNKPKRIKPKSAKLVALETVYYRERPIWLEGKMCAVYPWLPASEIHHKKGRVGYANGAKYMRGIHLLIDKDYWLPVSHEGHVRITNESEWAFKMGYSILRSNQSK